MANESAVSVDIEVYASGAIKLELWDPSSGQRAGIKASAAEMRKLRDTLTEAIEAAEGSQRPSDGLGAL
jgi:hypothetical protein